MEAKKELKNKKFWSYVGVVALVLAAVIIALLFYRQKIEVTRDVFKKITENWQTLKIEKYGFELKYPEKWTVEDLTDDNAPKSDPSVMYVFKPEESNDFNTVKLRVNESRLIDYLPGVEDAVQISIPFDKKNYLIFSTSTNNEFKEEFYNIPVTLKIAN